MSLKFYGNLAHVEDSMILPNDSGKGLRVGRFAETSDWGWRDITSEIVVRGIGGSSPTWAQVGTTGFRAYSFAVNDECWMTFHIPHDIVPGSDIHLHTHWFPDGTDTNPVKWQYDYAYAKGFNQAAFDFALAESPLTNAGTATSVTAGPGVQYQHMVCESPAITLPGLTEPDGLIHCHIKRITNGATENTDGIFLLTADVHYQSTNMATKQKAPGFYAD